MHLFLDIVTILLHPYVISIRMVKLLSALVLALAVCANALALGARPADLRAVSPRVAAPPTMQLFGNAMPKTRCKSVDWSL